MVGAVELTTFRLNKGLTARDFIAANEDINVWLKGRPGFISRHICQRSDGTIVDMLLWASAEDGAQAAEGIVTDMAGSPVHAAIDQSTVEWSIASVLVHLER
jgi:hypothetical protein